jgi:uncharacterized membrane protein (DUF485 family)
VTGLDVGGYDRHMARVRTQGRTLLRHILFRAYFALFIVAGFVIALLAGSLVVAVISGLLALWQIGMTLLLVWLYRRADPVALSLRIDPGTQAHWGYLRPNKFPYIARDTSDNNVDR